MLLEGGGGPNTGLKRPCPLNLSNFFHIGENFILDATHDIPEGVGPFLFKFCVYQWSTNKIEYGITANFLNQRISSFHYSRCDNRNKPSPRFTETNLREKGNYSTKQRASQSLCLIRNFALLYGDKIPENDPHFRLMLLFLEICDIIFAPAITLGHCNILKDMIFVLFEQFNELFPDVQPINKIHHLIHYPDIMKLHGPPIRYWCMRFESFHYVMKRRAQFIGNFTNICKSLACHVQRLHCLNLLDDKVLSPEITIGPIKKDKLNVNVHMWLEASQLDILCNPLNQNIPISFPKLLKVGGWQYFSNSIIVIKKSFETNSGLPKFGRISSIIRQSDSDFFFCLSVLKTIAFERRYHAYVVEDIPDKNKILCINMCMSVEPLDIVLNFSNNSNKYVRPRHVV